MLEAGDRYPSGVVRGLIYKSFFQASGIDVEFVSRQPLGAQDWLTHPPALLRRIVWKQRVRNEILRRAELHSEEEILRKAATVDVVYLSKVLSLSFYRRLRAATRARLVLDFGDAVWMYDGGKHEPEFQEVLRTVDAVTTDNEWTAEYVRRFNQQCTVIPDTPPLEEFERMRGVTPRGDGERLTLGWIGSPTTTYNLYEIWVALEKVAIRHPHVHLRLVGAGYDRNLWPSFERVGFSVVPAYDQQTMISEVLRMDIGLFPLQDVEKSRVRGILKALNYMAGGAAVIASPVGQTPEVIVDGQTGLLASSESEWVEKLDALIGEAALRNRIAAQGLELVRRQFRTEDSWNQLRGVLLGRPE